jgi:hypothetical protein
MTAGWLAFSVQTRKPPLNPLASLLNITIASLDLSHTRAERARVSAYSDAHTLRETRMPKRWKVGASQLRHPKNKSLSNSRQQVRCIQDDEHDDYHRPHDDHYISVSVGSFEHRFLPLFWSFWLLTIPPRLPHSNWPTTRGRLFKTSDSRTSALRSFRAAPSSHSTVLSRRSRRRSKGSEHCHHRISRLQMAPSKSKPRSLPPDSMSSPRKS